MLSMRPVETPTLARLCLALLPLLLVLPVVVQGQTTPAVSTVVAFNGSAPNGGLVLGSDGALYGTTSSSSSVAGGLIYRTLPDGSSVTTLHQLANSEGYSPQAGLLLASDDLLYGTTSLGAVTQPDTTGTVFRLATDGRDFSIVHRFANWTSANANASPINTDGAYPDAALIEGSDGALYGVTRAGGPNGTGTVFRLSRDGTSFQSLHAFGPITSASGAVVVTNADGMSPLGDLVQAADGFLYGTATQGGANGRGTVFRLRLDGSGFEVRHTFSALSSANPPLNADGAAPLAGLTDGEDGLLYGVTSQGGGKGYGTVFSLDPNSGLLTTLHDFDNAQGNAPSGALLLGLDSRLYGTTKFGGTLGSGGASSLGTIFSMARDGTGFTVLHNFDNSKGSVPRGKLLQLGSSVLVGVNTGGGNCGQGTIFRYSAAGDTVTGNTNCGQKKKNQYGGGTVTPALVALLGLLGFARRRRRT
jgi:uncharacterized repeat protein (TIGR03803 family)